MCWTRRILRLLAGGLSGIGGSVGPTRCRRTGRSGRRSVQPSIASTQSLCIVLVAFFGIGQDLMCRLNCLELGIVFCLSAGVSIWMVFQGWSWSFVSHNHFTVVFPRHEKATLPSFLNCLLISSVSALGLTPRSA